LLFLQSLVQVVWELLALTLYLMNIQDVQIDLFLAKLALSLNRGVDARELGLHLLQVLIQPRLALFHDRPLSFELVLHLLKSA